MLVVMLSLTAAVLGGTILGKAVSTALDKGLSRRVALDFVLGGALIAGAFLAPIPAHARTLTIFAGSATQNTLQDSKSAAYGFSYGGRYWHAGYLNLGHPGDGVKTDGVFGGIRDVQVIAGSPVSLSFNAGPYFFASTMPDGGVDYGASLLIGAGVDYALNHGMGLMFRWDRITFDRGSIPDVDVFLLGVRGRYFH